MLEDALETGSPLELTKCIKIVEKFCFKGILLKTSNFTTTSAIHNVSRINIHLSNGRILLKTSMN